MNNPALWTAIAGCVVALGGVITAIKAHSKINDHYENDHMNSQVLNDTSTSGHTNTSISKPE